MSTSKAEAVAQSTAETALAVPDAADFARPEERIEHIHELLEAYPRLQTPAAGAETVLRHKLAHAFWRARLLERVSEILPELPGSSRAELVEAMAALKTHIPTALLDRLRASVEPRYLTGLLASQGIRSADGRGPAAGPQLDLKISANRSSSWSFEKWSRIEEFGRYDFDGDGVRYRGVLLRPGDVLLSNCNLDGNGIYTTLGDPKAYTSHSALFAILEVGGRRFPAAIETFEKGVRPVPLNVFLSPRFAAYTEVYRHVGLTTEHTDRVNEAALTMIREVKGYNFDTCDSSRDYVSCTGVPRFALEDAGLDPGTTKSFINDPGIRRNLIELEYDFFDFSSPIDFVLSEEYRCVGWVDNNQVDKLVARELVEVRFRQLFSQREIDFRRMPLAYRINRWGIGHMRRRSLPGRIISAAEGFDHETLPKGPDALLALIKPAEQQIGGAIKKVHPVVQDHLSSLTRFDLQQVRDHEPIRHAIDSHLRVPWLVQPG
jgi:hypothetical protein